VACSHRLRGPCIYAQKLCDMKEYPRKSQKGSIKCTSIPNI
jgi:hypothetical protein